MPKTDKLLTLLENLIQNGDQLVATATREGPFKMIRDGVALRRWSDELILFCSLAGDLVRPWKGRLVHNGDTNVDWSVQTPLSALKTIKDAIRGGLLSRYQDLIIADTFADLTEQAAHLLNQGYFLAAGVIYRAVLEERLRLLCARNNVTISKPRPTINDFNQALYSFTPPIYDKSMMLHITALAAVGNDAAHNSPNLNSGDVTRLANGLSDFLARFSV